MKTSKVEKSLEEELKEIVFDNCADRYDIYEQVLDFINKKNKKMNNLRKRTLLKKAELFKEQIMCFEAWDYMYSVDLFAAALQANLDHYKEFYKDAKTNNYQEVVDKAQKLIDALKSLDDISHKDQESAWSYIANNIQIIRQIWT